MRLSEMCGKMVVNLDDGEVLGNLGDADLLIDEVSGEIKSILMPLKGRFLENVFDRNVITIEWSNVKKIGTEIIVVELSHERTPLW